MEDQDILFGALMGYRNVGVIQRANVIQNDLAKRVLPVIPFLPLQNESKVNQGNGRAFNINDNWTTRDSIEESSQFFPLSFSFTEGGQKWMFPYEPMINISSGNNIIKRNVAKLSPKNESLTGKFETSFGTVKERWSRKDFEISVTGVLIGSIMQGTAQDCFPKKQMIALFDFLTYAKEIFIYCEPLEILGITKVVVEDYSFPFTKGENVQAYDIKLVSDTATTLLLRE